MSVMRTVRVANICHVSALPYRLLADVDFIKYEENTAAENARKLHEGEVDVALISVAEFAMHGGYVGLDFGIGCRGRSETLMLYSHVPLEEIEAVNIYSGSSSTALLLRLILSKYYNVSPLLVRRRKTNLLDHVVGKDAALVFHDLPEPLIGQYAVAIDLVKIWAELTGKPYVSSVWAVRSGMLRPEHHRWFNDAFHRAAKARDSFIRLSSSEHGISPNILVSYINDCIDYYYDIAMIEGMEKFFEMAGDLSLLPRTKYRSATWTLIGRQTPRVSQERSVAQILEGVLDGARLGIREGLRLAYEASISDVSLVAETIRNRISPQRLARPMISVSITEAAGRGDPLPGLMSEIRGAVNAGVLHVRIAGLPRVASDLVFWEKMLRRIKQKFPLMLEALSASELHWMASLAGVPAEQLIARLVRAGLDVVGGEGGDMLVDRVMADGLPGFLSVQDWLTSMRWVHRFGGSTRAHMRVSRHDSWEDRILHLHKIRSLQDEMPGFRSFSLTHELATVDKLPAEVRVRCTAIARIFLDNISTIEEADVEDSEGTAALLSVGAGVRDVRMAEYQTQRQQAALKDSLGRIGISLADDSGQILARR